MTLTYIFVLKQQEYYPPSYHELSCKYNFLMKLLSLLSIPGFISYFDDSNVMKYIQNKLSSTMDFLYVHIRIRIIIFPASTAKLFFFFFKLATALTAVINHNLHVICHTRQLCPSLQHKHITHTHAHIKIHNVYARADARQAFNLRGELCY